MTGRAFEVRPAHIAGFLLAFACVWLTHLNHTALTAPQDNLEQLMWVYNLELGYYKHPALPTWLFWPFQRVLGHTAWASYICGAVVTLSAFYVFWLLLRRLRGSLYATIALLAALSITYYNGRLYYYNHNIVLLLAVCCAAYACWIAFETRQLRWWAALGLALGLGANAKYQIAISVLCLLIFFLQQKAWRDAAQIKGLVLAGGVSIVVFVPHAVWLLHNNFAPFHYASQTSLGMALSGGKRLQVSVQWLLDMLFNRALPAWLVLGTVMFVNRRQIGQARAAASQASVQNSRDEVARWFLLIWGFGPLLLMFLLGLTGADLQLQWGTAFLLFAVPAMMELFRCRSEELSLKSSIWAFAAVQIFLLVLSHVTSYRGVERLRDAHWRSLQSPLMAERILPAARAQLGGKVRFIIGPATLSNALALQAPERPRTLIDGRYEISPWVERSMVERCGAVELYNGKAPPDAKPLGASLVDLSWRVRKPLSGVVAADC